MTDKTYFSRKVGAALLRGAVAITCIAAIAAIVNFIVHGNNSNNSSNLHTVALWLAISAVIFLLRKFFIKKGA